MIRSIARGAVGLAMLIAGCDNGLSHPFGAYAYNETDECLGASAIIDVLDGAAKSCTPEVRCFIAPSGAVFVTDKACDAPPDFVEHTKDTEGPCVKALEAYASKGHGRCAKSSGDEGS